MAGGDYRVLVGVLRQTESPDIRLVIRRKRKEPVFRLVLLLVLAFPIFPGRPTYCPAEETLRWSVSGRKPDMRKKNQTEVWFFCSCWHYLSSWAGQGLSCRNNRPVDGYRQKKPPAIAGGFICWHSLSSRVGQRIVLPKKHSGGVFPAESEYAQKRTRPKSGSSVCVGITYLPGQSPAKYCRRT